MLYVANDVESAGSKLGCHSTLSIGAAIITPEEISFEDYWKKDLVFYAELQPESRACELETMKVGCSQLECLEEIKHSDPRFDTKSELFNPSPVLMLMEEQCESPAVAVGRLVSWLESKKKKGDKVVGVTDTVFFDGGRMDLCFSRHHRPSPYGWSGLDLDSVYRGYMRNPHASLKSLGLKDERTKPHRADQDAVYLAQMGRVLLGQMMGWHLSHPSDS